MGHAQSINTSSSRNASVASESGFSSSGGGRPKHGKEHKRHGVVTLKMVVSNPTRRANDQVVTHTITPKGCILYGSQAFDPMVVQQAISTSGYPIVPPSSLQLADNRAHKILVSYCKGWHIVPFPEIFSRHSGTCLILGDRTITSPPFQIKVGDCFRLGSVGLVVSEMRADGEVEQRIDAKTLEFLKDEALAFDTNGDMATLAADEERMGQDGLDTTYDADAMDDDPDNNCDDRDTQTLATHTNLLDQDADHTHQGQGHGHHGDDGCATPPRGTSLDSAGGTPLHFEDVASPDLKKPPKCAKHSVDKNLGFGGISPGERFVCYMCYETHDTEEDALVAPCDCRGDTRYLHVQCLQKWYQASITGVQTQVIRTTGNGAPACKICGSAYKTAFRRADGRKASLLETESNGPYLSLVVVTKHDTNPGLFNTKFRLNFHSRAETAQNAFGDNQDDNIITIGRSSSCNMILDYRTVSTIHARITYEADGKFYLTDRRSSNGTMVYLQDPFPLPYNHSLKLRMGRTTLSLQAKRNWTSSLRTLLGTSLPSSELLSPTPEDIQGILSECVVPEDHDQNNTVKEDAQNGDDEHRQDGESPVMHNGNNNIGVSNGGAQQQLNSRGDLYLRSNQPEGGEPDSDMDYSLDTHNHPNTTTTNNNYNSAAYPNQQLHTSTLTNTNVHGALLTSTEVARSQRNMTEDGSLRSMNTNNTNNNSLHSSMTGVTANTNLNHPYATLPFNSTQFNTSAHNLSPGQSGRGAPPRTSSFQQRASSGVLNGSLHGEESYVGLDEVHGLAMTAEERQEQADLDRAIELSLLEHNTKESASNANNTTNTTNNNAATPTNNSTPANPTSNNKEEVLMLSPGSRSNSSSRPYTPNTKTPNTHVSLNRTYTEFSSEGEHGIASFAANMNNTNNTSTSNTTSNNKNSVGVSDNRKMSASTTPPRSRQTSQGNIGIGEHINSSNNNGPASPLLPKSPSKALMDFSQPRVVGENDDDDGQEHSGHSGGYERPPSRHLSGASSPAHYTTASNTNTNTISVLQNGSGRLVMHDSPAEAEPINSNNNNSEGVTAGEGYLYPTSTTSGTRSARGSGTSAGIGSGGGSSIHSNGSGKHGNSGGSGVADELSTSMPIANAFTPFGQMSQKKSTQNLSADTTSAATAPNTNTTNNNNNNTTTTSNTPPTMEPIKESSTNSLFLSKEHSFVKNNSSTNTTSNTTSNTAHAPLEKQRSGVKGVDTTTTYPSGSAYIGGGSGNESPTMQRNATTLDLETSPDHDEHDKQR